jgi:DNA-binding LacI/PurR family transcriptional regulator
MGSRPTLEDVAARAGVSRALVSLVIRGASGASQATTARVLKVAAEIGYRPDPRARLLARSRSRSRLLGVTFAAQHPFHADLLEGIYLAAEPTGYDIALSAPTPSRGEDRAVDSLLDYRCEALLLLGPEAPAARLAELAGQLPVLVVARRVRAASVQVVRTADDEGIRLAVEHLISLGHRDIVHVDGGHAPGAADRRRGYRTAMRDHGLSARVLPGGPTEQAGGAAAHHLLSEGLPSAVIAFNDRCAVGLLDTVIRTGVSVPGDVSIVGYDDDRLSRLAHINLTTVGQDVPMLASLAVRRLVARLDGAATGGREDVIAPHLIVRGTTAAPRADSGRVTAGGSRLPQR